MRVQPMRRYVCAVGIAALWLCGTVAPWPSTVRAQSSSCDEIRLEGASTRAEQDAGFREQWRPALRRATECLAEAGERACIEVQGQYDEQGFEDGMGRVAGGGRAAQIQRARGRSGAVVSELVDGLGVDYTRVRERPPGTDATFRGATLRVIEGCLPEAPEAKPRRIEVKARK